MGRGITLLIPKLGTRWGMDGQCHASHTISLAKSPRTCRGDGVGFIAGLDSYEEKIPCPPLGFNPWSIKPIVSHPIHCYAILAPNIEGALSLWYSFQLSSNLKHSMWNSFHSAGSGVREDIGPHLACWLWATWVPTALQLV